MTPRKEACSGTRAIIDRWRAVAFALVLAACGMRSGLFASSPDGSASGGSPGGEAGAGGITTNGSGGHASPDAGTVVGQGGVATGGRTASTPALGGSTTFGRGGSPGSSNGGNGSGGRGSGGMGAGGRSGTGGSTTTSRDGAVDTDAFFHADAALPGAPTIDPNSGYLTINAGSVVLSGSIVSSCAGSGTICGGLTYTENSFCASGTVGASSTYKSWANAAFNVNQSQSGASGSTSSLPFVGSSITVSYSNKSGSTLELQLWDGNNYWCAYLPPSAGPNTINIPFSRLNSACWDMRGTAFVSGTSVEMVQFLVPCSATTPTPFDYCFLGLTVQ